METGEKIKWLRKNFTPWNQEQFGDELRGKIDGNQQYISHIEAGRRKDLMLSEIREVAKLLNVRFTDLVGANNFDPLLVTRLENSKQ